LQANKQMNRKLVADILMLYKYINEHTHAYTHNIFLN